MYRPQNQEEIIENTLYTHTPQIYTLFLLHTNQYGGRHYTETFSFDDTVLHFWIHSNFIQWNYVRFIFVRLMKTAGLSVDLFRYRQLWLNWTQKLPVNCTLCQETRPFGPDCNKLMKSAIHVFVWKHKHTVEVAPHRNVPYTKPT